MQIQQTTQSLFAKKSFPIANKWIYTAAIAIDILVLVLSNDILGHIRLPGEAIQDPDSIVQNASWWEQTTQSRCIRTTEVKLLTLSELIALYHDVTGALPQSLNGLRGSLGLTNGDIEDCWQEPFAYYTSQIGYVILSRGPDQSLGTRDDIWRIVPINQLNWIKESQTK